MKNLKAKLRKNGGFTLIEMLIVVAIIAILVAISIPLVGSVLEKSRDATDQANVRAAKAETVMAFMGVTDTASMPTGYTAGSAIAAADKIYYDAAAGKLTKTAPKPYGQCTGCGNLFLKDGTTADTTSHVDCWIQVEIDANGNFGFTWVKYSLQGTTQGRYLTGGVPPVRFSM